MKLGFIGFGEAAFEMAKGLKSVGLQKIVVYDLVHDHPLYGPLVKERVEKSEVQLVYTPNEVINQADILIVAVPGSKALETAQALYPGLRKDTLYVDISASPVRVKRLIWEAIKDRVDLFVDAAMLGPLPMYQHKVPIAASGSGTDKFMEFMLPYGMNIEKISDTPGEATAIKLVRSIFIKGLSALLMEVLDVASTMDVSDVVLQSISSSMNEKPFEFTVNRLITGTAIHAERRSHEMSGAIEMMEEIKVDPVMAKATKARLEWMAAKNLKEKFGGKTPDSFKDVLSAW